MKTGSVEADEDTNPPDLHIEESIEEELTETKGNSIMDLFSPVSSMQLLGFHGDGFPSLHCTCCSASIIMVWGVGVLHPLCHLTSHLLDAAATSVEYTHLHLYF